MRKERLTEKEEEVMLLLWEHGPCSVKELVGHMGDPAPHVNTVSTFVRLLEKRGHVGHRANGAGGYDYYALRPKSEYARSKFSRFIDTYFGNCFSMVSELVEDEKLNADELRQLLEMIENKKGK